ncbi:IclR family transcriptional regulator domain-containing protein [Pseudonocardia acidicola]|uniref:IclR family transcriptional regulator n=1 Tax=Pseudonocardia acidicola TaxID=2724939 RepID=A0ABX1S7G7_9PSEU|nr:IclR family transcriptional regulator [Pseudonocardia acidicola]
MRNQPAYAITSVDHALRLARILQVEGPLRVSEAAERLGIARSTAHRLLAMLVYRDFAVQDDERRYRAGPALRPASVTPEPVTVLRGVALPHLRALVERTGETANLQVLVGTVIRFVATVESEQVLRVGDREGRELPAHLVSGGKALLAALAPSEVDARCAAGGPDRAVLARELELIRERGFAINDQLTEPGVMAVGMAVRDPHGVPLAGVSVSLPSVRFDRDRLPGLVGALSRAVAGIERDLAAQP